MSKASKKRFCPAVNHDISAAECGENRGSRYVCPGECKFNPFGPGNYDLALEMDEALNAKMTGYLARILKDVRAFDREMEKVAMTSGPHGVNAHFTWKFFLERDAEGLTIAQRWEKEGFPGLKNDEQVLMRARIKTRPGLVEVHRVIDEELFEGVDLLSDDPKPIQFRDRSLAARALRFSRFLTWVAPYPHYGRMIGTGINIPEMELFEPRQIVRELVKQCGGPTDLDGIRQWLGKNLELFDRAINATLAARQAAKYAQLDLRPVKVVYELQVPFLKARELLDAAEEVFMGELRQEEEDEGFSQARFWHEVSAEGRSEWKSNVVLGRILLGQSHWRIEALGEVKNARLRERFEKLMGSAIKFSGQRIDDAPDLTQSKTIKDRNLVPELLLQVENKLDLMYGDLPPELSGDTTEESERKFFEEQNRRYLDATLPCLEGKTPRQAAKDARLRPMLVELMKQRVRAHDERCLKQGVSWDINWVLTELRLDEIIFPPPQFREYHSPGEVDEDIDEDFDDAEYIDPLEGIAEPDYVEPNMNLPLAAVPRVLSDKEAEIVASINLKTFNELEDAFEELKGAGSNFLRFAWDLCEDLVSPVAFTVCLPVLVQCRFLLVPRGNREPEMNFERAWSKLDDLILQMSDQPQNVNRTTAILRGSRQKGVLAAVMQLLVSVSDAWPEGDPVDFGYLTILLRTLVDELHESLEEANGKM